MGKAVDEVLIVGASSRALAESAATAGFRVLAVDAYGDLDLLARAHTIALRRDLGVDWSPRAAVTAADRFPAAAASPRRGCWQGRPRPAIEARGCSSHGAPAAVEACAPGATGDRCPGRAICRRRWTAFPAPSASWQTVGVPWRSGSAVSSPASLLWGGPEPLFPREPELSRAAEALAAAATEAFGLVGVNGIDFIARDGVPWPLEVNPRYSASMELIERVHGLSIFGVHADACEGRLPSSGLLGRATTRTAGKAIVYARTEVIMGHLRRWWSDDRVRDVPHPGERIAKGGPICTVFADGSGAAGCREALLAQAAVVYAAARGERAA